MKTKIELLAPTEYWESLENRKKQLQILLNEIEKETKKLIKQLEQNPLTGAYISSSINISKSNGVTQFYVRKNKSGKNTGKGKYISVKEKHIIKNILQQNYYKKVKKIVLKELIKIDKLLYLKNEINNQAKRLPIGKQKLIQPVTMSDSEYIKIWQNIPFIAKTFFQSDPELYTPKGLRVRSKSEIIIATVLDKYRIPFRYEFPVTINKKIFYPDFYCLNVRTRKEFIWEHFGIMDNLEYSKNALEKLVLYNESGFFIGKNLITTFEQSNFPLKINQVEQLINQYLL